MGQTPAKGHSCTHPEEPCSENSCYDVGQFGLLRATLHPNTPSPKDASWVVGNLTVRCQAVDDHHDGDDDDADDFVGDETCDDDDRDHEEDDHGARDGDDADADADADDDDDDDVRRSKH